jgi:valyl-tRNA synthetase
MNNPDTDIDFAKYFDFAVFEQEIYTSQEQAGLFKAGANAKENAESFCIMIPPPNVTGSLHIGHALNNTLQDILIRYNRMLGKNVLWQVGCDHAGIATQALVERKLDAEGIKKSDLGRDAFIEKIWNWKQESGGTIMHQLRRLGASADFSRERFTMDEGLSKSVLEVFVTLYNQGLIYKDKRLVNWDCHLQTAISDLEVIPTDTKSFLWHFAYQIDGTDEKIIIATTRPETMFGDSAIAVNPDDKRYQHLVGKMAIIPISGRKIPIIADDYADSEMGTGAVKITPAHDFNDFEVGKRHDLPIINILHKDGTLNDNVPAEYRGMDRFDARKKLIKELTEAEILTEIKPHPTKIPHGDRSGTVIEPFLTDQWYVTMEKMAERALRAVKKGDAKFIPENWKKTYDNWLIDIQPWCISRQLWWGHQIPAWYDDKGNVYVAKTQSEAQAQAGEGVSLTQDSDVLDTWFSSALWPFSTLGFPDTDNDFYKTYYPTNVLITGFDIIFFWVARMIMMGLHFTDEMPFKDIYIHALVRDEKGQKMSKSKGNVIDPLDLINEYGADSVRFTLTAMAAQGRDIKLSKQRVEGYRNFGTKIWNASRFAHMNGCVYRSDFNPQNCVLPLSHWILEKLKIVIGTTFNALNTYRFNDYANGLYHFVWNDICDNFIEMSKPLLSSENESVKTEIQNVTAYVLRQAYIMLHPIMPFITEKLAEITTTETLKPLVHTQFPDVELANKLHIPHERSNEIDVIVNLISEIRSLRVALNVPASAKLFLIINQIDVLSKNALESNQEILVRMARLNGVSYRDASSDNGFVGFVCGGITASLPLADFIDLKKEKERLNKDITKIELDIKSMESRLNNEHFIEKATPEVIDETKQKLQEAKAVFDKVSNILQRLK